jgi:outer membrane cobalamin receptor
VLRRHALVVLIAALCRSAPALADSGTGATPEQGIEDTLTLLQAEEKTVTADLRPESEDTAPAVVTVVDRRQIAAMGARTLLDVLRTTTGVDIGRTPLGDDQVTFRGSTNPAELLVMIDGQRINNVFNGYAPLDLPVELIDRVEILRGPGSALYGTDAFAGVVQVFTRHPEGVVGSVEAGDSGGGDLRLDAFRYQLGIGNRTGKLSYGLSIAQSTQGGAQQTVSHDLLNPPPNADQQPLSPLTGQSQSAAPGTLSDWRNQLTGDARIALASLFTEGDQLALTGRLYSESHGEYFGPLATFAPDGSISLTQDQAQLSYDAPLSSVFKLMVRLYLDRQRIDDLVDLDPPGYVSVPPGLSSGFFPDGEQKSLTVTSLTYGGEARLTANLPFHNTATAGFQLEEEAITYYQAGINFGPGGNYLGGLEPDPNATGPLANGVSRRVLGAYLQDIFEPWTPLSIIAGLRLDDYSDFGSSWNPRVSVVYRPSSLIWAKAMVGSAFSAPTFQQLYDNTSADLNGGYVGNPNLGPEKIWTGEAEVGLKVPLSGGGFDVTANGFYNDITGSIEEIPLFGNLTPLANAANVSQWGVEGQVRLRWKWLSVSANVSDLIEDLVTFSYSDPAIQLQATSSELTDIPRVLANLDFSLGPFYGLTLTALTHFASERQNDWRTALETAHAWTIPPEVDLDLVLSTVTFWSFFRAFVAVYNATGTPMYDPTPYANDVANLPRMPTSLICALRVDY